MDGPDVRQRHASCVGEFCVLAPAPIVGVAIADVRVTFRTFCVSYGIVLRVGSLFTLTFLFLTCIPDPPPPPLI